MKWLGVIILAVMLAGMFGCSATDPLTDDLYSSADIYADNIYVTSTVTADTISGTTLDVPHAATHENGGSDEILDLNSEVLANLAKSSTFFMLPVSSGWTTALVGSGAVLQQPFRLYLQTGATANSSATAYAPFYGFNEDGFYYRMNWDKKLFFIFNLGRATADAEFIGRVQIKESSTIGNLAERGIGVLFKGYDFYVESYGTVREEINTGLTISSGRKYQIVVLLDNTVPEIKFYANGVLVITQSDATYIPSGIGTVNINMLVSSQNGAAGGANPYITMMEPIVWQGR
jgi:hypothetical protein